MVLCLGVAAGLGTFGRWIAAAIVIALLPLLLGRLQQAPLCQFLRRRVPMLVLGGLGLVLLGELVLGRPPASRDHAIHYFQTHVFVGEILSNAHLSGWSDRFNNGYPFGELYPVLGYLWMGAAHLISFGLIPLRVSYAWGTLAMWFLAVWGVWRLASVVTQEILAEGPDTDASSSLPAWAGCVGGALWLLDPGASRQGGWNYAMFHGVWPQLLSATLWIVSLTLTWEAFRKPSPRRLAAAALVLSASLLAHPFGAFTIACSMVAWPVALAATDRARALPNGTWRWWLLIHGVALLITAWWWVDFLASAQHLGRNPGAWGPLSGLATELVAGSLFEGPWMWAGPLAVIGIILVIRRGSAMAWLTVGLLVALLMLGSTEAVGVLQLDLVAEGFRHLKFPRFAVPIKPLFSALAGVGVVVVLAGLRTLATRRWPADRPWLRRAAAGVILAPLVVGVLSERLLPRPIGAVETIEETAHARSERALSRALAAERDQLGADRPLRVAFLRKGMGGGTYPIFAIADSGAGLVLDGHVPTVNFRHRVDRRTPLALQTLGVTHVIHDHDVPDKEQRLRDALELVGRYGPYKLERLLTPPSRAVVAPVSMRAKDAQIEVIAEGPGRLEAQVDPGQQPSTLTLVRAPYRKWIARLDGEILELDPQELAKGAFTGSKIEIPHAGRLELSYETSSRERVARWVSAIILLLALAALGFRRPLEIAERLHSATAKRMSWALGIGTLVIALVWVERRQSLKLAKTWNHVVEKLAARRVIDAPQVYARDLVAAGKFRLERNTKRLCGGLLGKDARVGCTEADARPRVGMMYREPYLYRCIYVTLGSRSTTTVIIPGIGPDAGVVGFIRRVRHSGKAKHLRWAVTNLEQERVVMGNERRDFYIGPDQAGDSVAIELTNRSRKLDWVCVAAAELR